MFYADPVETALTALSTAMSLLRAPLWSIQVLCSLAAAAVGISTAGSTSGGLLASAEGVYNSSITPSDLPWNTYNYCNAPHVNAAHYAKPTNGSRAELVYLNAVIRHHKVRGEDNGAPIASAERADLRLRFVQRRPRTTCTLRRTSSTQSPGTVRTSRSSAMELAAPRISSTRQSAPPGTPSSHRSGMGRATRASSQREVWTMPCATEK